MSVIDKQRGRPASSDGAAEELLTKVAELQGKSIDATTLLKSMSNEYRLAILCNLAQGEKSVSELQALVDISQSALSQHLAILRRDGIVRTRRHAQSVFYRIASEPAKAVMVTLYAYLCGGDSGSSPR